MAKSKTPESVSQQEPEVLETELLTIAQVAARLQLSLSQIGRLTRAGRLPCRQFGPKTIRYTLSDIDFFLKQYEQHY